MITIKVGSRVQLAPGVKCSFTKGASVRGVVNDIRGNCADVLWDTHRKRTTGYHLSFLIPEGPSWPEKFPYRSHRTMAQVIEDERNKAG